MKVTMNLKVPSGITPREAQRILKKILQIGVSDAVITLRDPHFAEDLECQRAARFKFSKIRVERG
jgi:hypothetical protein